MFYAITQVDYLHNYRVRLRFADGVVGEVDFAERLPFRGVFAAFADREQFLLGRVDQDAGTIVWPWGADVAPDALYADVTGLPMFEQARGSRGGVERQVG